jgi:hypothetical protein
MRRDQRAQPFPWHDRVHLIEEHGAFRLARIALKSRVNKHHLLFTFHEAHHSKRTFIFCHPGRSTEGAQSRDSDRLARSWRSFDSGSLREPSMHDTFVTPLGVCIPRQYLLALGTRRSTRDTN